VTGVPLPPAPWFRDQCDSGPGDSSKKDSAEYTVSLEKELEKHHGMTYCNTGGEI
jgi:hypothetical protein